MKMRAARRQTEPAGGREIVGKRARDIMERESYRMKGSVDGFQASSEVWTRGWNLQVK